MKTVTKQREPAREVEDVKLACDLCRKDITYQHGYDVSDVTIECEWGTSYPGSRSTESIVFDCCVECFKKRVVPALEGIGLHAREEECCS